MMMPSPSPGQNGPSPSGNWQGWQCDKCSRWNNIMDLFCRHCQYPRQPNSLVGIMTTYRPSLGSHTSSDRAFRVVVVVGIILIILLLTVPLLHLSFLPFSNPTSNLTPTPNAHQMGDTLYRGDWLNPTDDYIRSINGRYELRFQRDGNLVEYDRSNHNAPLWASNTANKGATIAELQNDGNFVIDGSKSGYILFATGTNHSHNGTSGYRLVIQSNANIVIYNESGQVLWQAKP